MKAKKPKCLRLYLICALTPPASFFFHRLSCLWSLTPVSLPFSAYPMAKVWRKVYAGRLSEIYEYIDDTILPLDEAWRNDCKRWGEDASQTAALRAERIKAALRRNIDWFNNHLPESQYSYKYSTNPVENESLATVYNLQGMPVGTFQNP